MNSIDQNSKPDKCQNCQFQLAESDNYCPNCGQKNLINHLTFEYFFKEFASNVFSLDSKLVTTIKNLVARPAFLSHEFIQGRRVSYINPIQLFIFMSFIYFLVNSLMFLKEESANDDLVVFNDGEKRLLSDSIDIQQQDTLFIVDDGQVQDTLKNSYIGNFLKKGKEFNAMDKEDQNEKTSRNISYAAFLLTPIFALYLGWFYRKRKKYLENIVFSLHFHAFFFLAGTLFLFLDKLIEGDIDSIIFYLLVLFYLLISLKRFYLFSWISTIARFLGLIILYGFTVSVFLIVSILISVLL